MNKQDVEERILVTEYTKLGEKTTICLITLDNGFEIVGTSSCVNPDMYNKQLGEKYAYEQAVSKAIEFLAYELQNENFISNCKYSFSNIHLDKSKSTEITSENASEILNKFFNSIRTSLAEE